jgi:hypothetical protein
LGGCACVRCSGTEDGFGFTGGTGGGAVGEDCDKEGGGALTGGADGGGTGRSGVMGTVGAAGEGANDGTEGGETAVGGSTGGEGIGAVVVTSKRKQARHRESYVQVNAKVQAQAQIPAREWGQEAVAIRRPSPRGAWRPCARCPPRAQVRAIQ